MENPFEEIINRLERIERRLNQMSEGKKAVNVQGTWTKADDIIEVAEAAALLRVSVQTIYGKTHRRQIPFYKVGKKLLFKRDELAEMITGNREKTSIESTQEQEANFININTQKSKRKRDKLNIGYVNDVIKRATGLKTETINQNPDFQQSWREQIKTKRLIKTIKNGNTRKEIPEAH